jgi:endonuclease/exonuclease/phosphatase family metal-dependent hydrolase
MQKLKKGPQSRAPLKWGEGAKNLTASRHRGCPKDVPCSKRREKKEMRIGTWNVRTLMSKGKLENAKREMQRNRIDVLGLSEVRWQGTGDFYSDRYRVIYAGGSESQRGVAVILDGEVAKRVIEVVQRSDRILLVKLQAEPVDIAIVQVYMPTSAHDEQDVEDMYEEIESIMGQVKGNECLVVMGDWNAIVGEGREGTEVGQFGLGTRNERGEKLVEFCRRRQLMIANTWYQKEKRRRYTWTMPGERGRHQIDYILVRQRYRNAVKNAGSYPGADIDSDHNLVVMNMQVKLKKLKRRKIVQKWNREKLKENRKVFQEEVNVRISQKLGQGNSVERKWKMLKEAVSISAETYIGFQKGRNPKKPWVTEEMLHTMDERRKWKNNKTESGKKKYRHLNSEIRRETQKARNEWWLNQCNELQELDRKGRADLTYSKIKQLTEHKKYSSSNKAVASKRGEIITDPENVRARWKEYVEELYDKEGRPDVMWSGFEKEEEVQEDAKGPVILEEEVLEAIKSMKDKKAEGVDGIPAEFWKCLEGEGMIQLIQICQQIYQEGCWPEEFTKTVMVPIPKKSNAIECGDFRTISLIPHVSKILLRILMRRIDGKVGRFIGRSQFGFRKGVGTRDAIGVMRVLVERSLEHDNDVYVCFVDFEKAFDRVDWRKLLNLLKEYGVDWKDRRLIADLYMRQEVMIKVDSEMSEAGTIGRGVRQGCLMSPLLFSLYVEAMMNECLENSENGIKVGGQWIQDVRFADDQAMVDSTEEGLQSTMNALNDTAKKYGMKINTKKTKVMRISRSGRNDVTINLEGQKIEQVKKFQYLGAWITDDGRCEVEIKARIASAKIAFSKKKELLTRSLCAQVKKKIIKTVIWSSALYAAETWTLRKDDMRRIEALEMWIWRRMMKVPWTAKKSNNEILRMVEEERQLLSTVVNRKKKWLGHVLRGDSLLKLVIEGRMEGKRSRGRKRFGLMEEFLEGGSYGELKERARDRVGWRFWMPGTCLAAEH